MLYLSKQFDPIHVRDIGIGNDDIDVVWLALDKLPSLKTADKGCHFAIGAVFDCIYGEVAHQAIIINDENLKFYRGIGGSQLGDLQQRHASLAVKCNCLADHIHIIDQCGFAMLSHGIAFGNGFDHHGQKFYTLIKYIIKIH